MKVTKPCEWCGKSLTKTATEQSQRKYWTCGMSCANKLRIARGNTPQWGPNPLRGRQETRPCGVCGTPVTRYLSQVRTQQTWTCSKPCAASLRTRRQIEQGTWMRPQKPRTGDTVPCSVCGKPFYRQPAYIKQGRHLCSPACNRIWQTKPATVKTCARQGCENMLTLKPSQTARQYCSKACESLARIKRPLDRIHNGKPARLDEDGYVWLWEPEHPNNVYGGWQPEHRMVVERELGRYLTKDEQVDHINRVRHDNRPENLQVLDASTHSKKTWSDNLGALNDLRAKIAEYEAELEAARKQLRDMTQ